MNEKYIENTLDELKRSSKVSLFMVLLGAICLIGGLYYSATQLAPLEKKVSQLNKELESKKAKLEDMANAFDLLQGGTQFLFNRQYDEAINSYKKYLEIFPRSSEVLAMLGYAELRYAKSLKSKNSKNNNEKKEIIKYEGDSMKYLTSSEINLKNSIETKKHTNDPWAEYNLTLVYMELDKKRNALSILSKMLNTHPKMVNWLCEDGQFRSMALDKEINQEFTSLVNKYAALEGLSKCWVTKLRK